VERFLHHHDGRLRDAALVAVLARELDGALVRFEARVAEEHLLESRDLRHAVGRRLLVRDAPQVGGVDDAGGDARRERAGELRMPVAERVDGDAGERIEVLPAFLVPEPHAFAAHEGDALARVGVHDMGHDGLPKAKRRHQPPFGKS